MISGVGALIGIAIAVAIPFVIEALVQFLPVPGGIAIPISWLSVLAAFIVSCATGVLFGYLPAKKAAEPSACRIFALRVDAHRSPWCIASHPVGHFPGCEMRI